MADASFEQFLNVLRNDAARRRAGISLSEFEAARVASDPTLARAYYENWCRQAHTSAPLAAQLPDLPSTAKRPLPMGARSASTPRSRNFLDMRPVFLVAHIAAFLSLVAIFPWPYAYYAFLRWLLSMTAVLIAVHAIRGRRHVWLFAAVPILILWAPAAFIPLDRGVWIVLNIAVAVVLACAGWLLTAPTGPRADGKRRWQWWQIALLVFGIGIATTLFALPTNEVDCDVRYERSGTFCQ